MRAFGGVPDDKIKGYRVVRGSQATRLVQFSDPIRSYSLYAFGQSDNPASPHYADQVKLFGEKKMKPVYFTRDELEGHISSQKQLTIGPKSQPSRTVKP
jgi:acyl-homoserine-lactone acylase